MKDNKLLPVVSNSWAEARVFDWWSFVHWLSGAVIGQTLFFVAVSPTTGLVIALCISITWEVYEIITHVEEVFENRVTDIVLLVSGFLVTFMLLPSFSRGTEIVILCVASVILVVLSILGWRDWLHREKIKQSSISKM